MAYELSTTVTAGVHIAPILVGCILMPLALIVSRVLQQLPSFRYRTLGGSSDLGDALLQYLGTTEGRSLDELDRLLLRSHRISNHRLEMPDCGHAVVVELQS